jgi:predicted dehydrogenase
MVGNVLRVGIAGYGTVGKIRHQVVDAHPNFKTVAVCDKTFIDQFKEIDGVQCFQHYKTLLNEVDIDILFVCLPNYLASEVTIAGLEMPVHVFCEKPPGRNVEDIRRVIDVEKRTPGKKLMYGFNHRYHDSVLEALNIINSKELGKVLSMRGVYGKSKIISFDSDWRTKRKYSGGGILLDQGIHMVDMMRLIGGEFPLVHSFVVNSYWKHDVEDNVYAVLRSNNGVVAMLHSSATQWKHTFDLCINLTKGTINLSGILTSTKSYAPETINVLSFDGNSEPVETTTQYNEDQSWKREVDEFSVKILNDQPIRYGSSREALKTMELVYQIYDADPTWPSALSND